MNLTTVADPTTGTASGFVAALNAVLDQLKTNDQEIENRLERALSDLWGTGLLAGSYTAPLLSPGTGLTVQIAAFSAFIGFAFSGAASTMAVPASSTSYVWLFQDGTTSITATSANPGTTANPAILLGTATSSGVAVTGTSDAPPLIRPPKAVLAAAVALDFPSTAAGAGSDLTVTVTGAKVGDLVTLGTPAPPAGGCYSAWVDSLNTVKIRFLNVSSGALDPASGTFTVRVSPQ